MESELRALRAENARLRGLLGLDDRSRREPTTPWRPTLFTNAESPTRPADTVDRHSPAEQKIALFRSLFAGRDDVYALRWDNERTGKSGWVPAVRGGWAKARRPDREYLPYTDNVVETHLAGDVHAGLYPLQPGDSCRLLVCDFDGQGWILDSLAYLDAAHATGVPAGLERSRSGDGGHVWVFFDGSVPAMSARRIGVHMLREAMTVRAEIDLASYDRLFPARRIQRLDRRLGCGTLTGTEHADRRNDGSGGISGTTSDNMSVRSWFRPSLLRRPSPTAPAFRYPTRKA